MTFQYFIKLGLGGFYPFLVVSSTAFWGLVPHKMEDLLKMHPLSCRKKVVIKQKSILSSVVQLQVCSYKHFPDYGPVLQASQSVQGKGTTTQDTVLAESHQTSSAVDLDRADNPKHSGDSFWWKTTKTRQTTYHEMPI